MLLGVIADDFTGATDIANTLARQGMRVTLAFGAGATAAEADANADADAVVVALKTRSCPATDAVEQSLAALEHLQKNGARQVVFKYCSTFDSTAAGNIGPVADALLQAMNTAAAIVCPAFPANGRTIYRGYLFVGDALLAESPMKDHPLNPMRESNLLRLMRRQSSREVGLVDLDCVRRGADAINARIAALREQGCAYMVTDAADERDLSAIGAAAAGHALVTGASGVALGLPDNFRRQGLLRAAAKPAYPAAAGRAVVLAGSCSAATRAQLEHVARLWPCRKLDVDAVMAGADVAGEAAQWAAEQDGAKPVVIYASAAPTEVAQTQNRHGATAVGARLEKTMSQVARHLTTQGFNRLIIAGGETAGAVVSALGISSLRVGPEIDPGVPWTETMGGENKGEQKIAPNIALALKSGNFGAPDFFVKAFATLAAKRRQ